jgi:hypothetical protein
VPRHTFTGGRRAHKHPVIIRIWYDVASRPPIEQEASATAVNKGVCHWVAVMKPSEITASPVEEGAYVPPCPRKLMQVVARLRGEALLGQISPFVTPRPIRSTHHA